MSEGSETILSHGLILLLAILLLGPGILGALALNAPGDDEEDEEPWKPTTYQPYITPLFSGVLAEHFVELQLDLGPRYPGSAGHTEGIDFITKTMEEFGYTVEHQEFEFEGTSGTNIIARNGDPQEYYPDSSLGEKDTLILGAHFDTRPWNDQESGPQVPVMGANDGASGVAVLLELARVLSVRPVNLNLEFVFFDLEDSGKTTQGYAQGSKYYAESLSTENKERIIGAIVVDMIGDADLDIYLERYSDATLRDAIWTEADKLNYHEFHGTEKHTVFDDHVRLINQEIPSALLIDFDYPYWHTRNDTLDKVSGDSLEKVGRVLERYIYKLTGYSDLIAPDEDLIIPEGQTLTINGDVRHIQGDVVIDGTLNLDGTFLIINSEDGDEHFLSISDSGSLSVMGSTISSPGRSLKFESYGTLDIRDSLVEQLWGDTSLPPHRGGIQVYSPEFMMQNSTVRFSDSRGIFIENIIIQGKPAITKSSMIDNGEVGIYLLDSVVGIDATEFHDNGRGGIMVDGGGVSVTNSTLGYSFSEGSCTSGSCTGPPPTFGIRLEQSSHPSRIESTSISGNTYGVDSSYSIEETGSLMVRDVTFMDLDIGVQLLRSPATVSSSTFEGMSVGVLAQESRSHVVSSSITTTDIGFYGLASSGTVENNQVTGSLESGIYLVRSTYNISQNVVSEAPSGITMHHDMGTIIEDNVIHNTTFGINCVMSDEGDSVNMGNISNNTIYSSNWGVYFLGNRSSVSLLNNAFEMNGTQNENGNVREDRDVILHFLNRSETVFLWINSTYGESFHEEVVIWSSVLKVNLTVFEQLVNGTERDYGNYTIQAVASGIQVEHDFDPLVETSITLDFQQ